MSVVWVFSSGSSTIPPRRKNIVLISTFTGGDGSLRCLNRMAATCGQERRAAGRKAAAPLDKCVYLCVKRESTADAVYESAPADLFIRGLRSLKMRLRPRSGRVCREKACATPKILETPL